MTANHVIAAKELEENAFLLVSKSDSRKHGKTYSTLTVRKSTGSMIFGVKNEVAAEGGYTVEGAMRLNFFSSKVFVREAEKVLSGQADCRGIGKTVYRLRPEGGVEESAQDTISFCKDSDGKFMIVFKQLELDPDPIKFYFRSNRYWNVIDHTGQPLSDEEQSKAVAEEWISQLKELITDGRG